MVRPLIILERALARTRYPDGHPNPARDLGDACPPAFMHLARRSPRKLWQAIEKIRLHLLRQPLTNDLIPQALQETMPWLAKRDLAAVSEYLWFSSQDENMIRPLLQRLERGGIKPGSEFWSDLKQTVLLDSSSIWYVIPFILHIQRIITSITPPERRDELSRKLRVVTCTADVRLMKSCLRNLLDDYQLALDADRQGSSEHKKHPARKSSKQAKSSVTIPNSEPQAEEPIAPVPEPVEDTTPDPEPAPDPVLAWVMRMNGSRYDHLLDRIHRLADAWRQDVEPRESLLEPMAAVVLNLEKFLRTGGLRPRYPVGKHLTLGLEESADFEYAGAPFDGSPKQVVVTRPGWSWNGEPIGRPTVVEAQAVVPTS